MTTALALSQSRSPLTNITVEAAELVAQARAAWTRFWTYRRTLAAVRALPVATAIDLDLNRDDLEEIVHREVYGR